jgi:hypothetical protein
MRHLIPPKKLCPINAFSSLSFCAFSHCMVLGRIVLHGFTCFACFICKVEHYDIFVGLDKVC